MYKPNKKTKKSSQMATFLRPKTPLSSLRGWLLLSALLVSSLLALVLLPENNKPVVIVTEIKTGQALSLESNNAPRPSSYSTASGQIEKAEIESNQEIALPPDQFTNLTATHTGAQLEPLWSTIKLRPGDSLIRVLQKQQIDKADRNAIILANIKP